MLKLGEIRSARKSNKNVKRLGRGSGSGRGQTAGKGAKGQLQRSGGHSRRGFEGGQSPLYRRLPKRGFNNIFKEKIAVINLKDLVSFKEQEVNLDALKTAGLLKTNFEKLKVLSMGELKAAYSFKVHYVSAEARKKIEKAGGKIEVLA